MEPASASAAKPTAESGLRRTVTLAVAIIIAAILGVFAAKFSVSARGAAAPTLFASTQPVLSAVIVVLAMVAALLISLPLAKPLNAVVALFALGCAFAAFAMRTGTVADLLFLNGGMVAPAVETLLWSAFIAAASILMFRVGGPLVDVPAVNAEGTFAGEILHKRGLLSLLAGVVAIPVLIFTLVGPTKGQAIGACTMAGIAAAVVGRLIAPRAQPILLFAAPAFVIGAAQLVMAFSGMASPGASFVLGTLSPVRVPMPMDVAAGSLCGVAIGLGWSKGLVKKPAEPEPQLD